ncbi:hypothetical protein C6H88_01455 [Chlamydia muridarum str. Nigg]|uniref:Membrane protein n=2 Tax=Chlamydia muridarum TaxID=83560 RepID=A0A070A2G9_CHLMR|nr:hypothetical protein [Chlamydia muridarum]AAF39147.1 conserved hypothetical protein [Chlamydia muridarum str. Nigg]AHH22669.1 membrane protein [Chlamydia muridarum str. Nigg3 CMUT3-5]AHH23593.1 membrane protein [Chlamydia muridarum str. Nigg CM972]AID37815.1 membrane protein [Chlamydia muridarum str. Nigg 2 MCR]AIT90485.1 membrane protein [Chlamydia muridarum]
MIPFVSWISHNWLQKLVSLGFAIIIWVLANQSMTVTRTFHNIPVRVIDLSPEQTVIGLQPDGLLKKKVALMITGNKSVIEKLRPTDLEIVISAKGRTESWIETIDPYNLVCLDTDIRLRQNIKNLTSEDIFIRLTQLVTEDIAVTITKPIGKAPKGYEYLDVWPKYLVQKVSGPKEFVSSLKDQGLNLTFNLNTVSFEELDSSRLAQGNPDEIVYHVPEDWKKVYIPFNNSYVELNDPRADFLRLVFLKQEFIPLNINLPVLLFFPVEDSLFINPQNYYLEQNPPLVLNHGIYQLDLPLYVKDVSHLFLNVVKNNIALTIIMEPSIKSQKERFIHWAVEFLDEKTLEDAFVQAVLAQEREITKHMLLDEAGIRHRFREYLRKLTLFDQNGEPLALTARTSGNKVIIQVASSSLNKKSA